LLPGVSKPGPEGPLLNRREWEQPPLDATAAARRTRPGRLRPLPRGFAALLGLYLVPDPIPVVPRSKTGHYVTGAGAGRVVRWFYG